MPDLVFRRITAGIGRPWLETVLADTGAYVQLLLSCRDLEGMSYCIIDNANNDSAVLFSQFKFSRSIGDIDSRRFLSKLLAHVCLNSGDSFILATDNTYTSEFRKQETIKWKHGVFRDQYCLYSIDCTETNIASLLEMLNQFFTCTTLVQVNPLLAVMGSLEEDQAFLYAKKTALIAVPVFDDESFLVAFDEDAFPLTGINAQALAHSQSRSWDNMHQSERIPNAIQHC